MNALAPVSYSSPPSPQTHLFTLDDVITLREAGVLHPDARVELLDGEIIDMPAEGELHADFNIELNRFFVLSIGDHDRVIPGSRLSLAPKDAPVPEFYMMPVDTPLVMTPPEAIKLVVEIADSSLGQDLGRKAIKYGSYGIGEYWVVDVRNGVTHVHTSPLSGGYGERVAISFDQPLRPARLRELELIIADLPGLRPPA